jgi:cytochrome c553
VPATGGGEGVSRGKALYEARCVSCHGASAQGNARRAIPWLNSQHFEYLQREISYAVEHRRPNLEKDHAALFQSLSQQDIDGVADYLSRLPPT